MRYRAIYSDGCLRIQNVEGQYVEFWIDGEIIASDLSGVEEENDVKYDLEGAVVDFFKDLFERYDFEVISVRVDDEECDGAVLRFENGLKLQANNDLLVINFEKGGSIEVDLLDGIVRANYYKNRRYTFETILYERDWFKNFLRKNDVFICEFITLDYFDGELFGMAKDDIIFGIKGDRVRWYVNTAVSHGVSGYGLKDWIESLLENAVRIGDKRYKSGRAIIEFGDHGFGELKYEGDGLQMIIRNRDFTLWFDDGKRMGKLVGELIPSHITIINRKAMELGLI